MLDPRDYQDVIDFDISQMYPKLGQEERSAEANSLRADNTTISNGHEFFYHPESGVTTIRPLRRDEMETEMYLSSIRSRIQDLESWINNRKDSSIAYTDWRDVTDPNMLLGCGKGQPENKNWCKDEFIYIEEKYSDEFTMIFNICTREFILIKTSDNTIRDTFKYTDLKEERYARFIDIVDKSIWPQFMKYLESCHHVLNGMCVFVNEKCTAVFDGFTPDTFEVLLGTKSIVEARALCLCDEDIKNFALDYHNNFAAFPVDGTVFNIRKYIPDDQWQEFLQTLKARVTEKGNEEVFDSFVDVTSVLKTMKCDTKLKTMNVKTFME